MSKEQRENLDAILRQNAFPADGDVSELRRLLAELTSAQPLPADVTVTAAALGGVPAAEITVDGIEPRHVVLYFHGGVYVLGDASRAAGLAAQIGRRTGARVISVDYRLAPEHPYPAAVDDALAAYEALAVSSRSSRARCTAEDRSRTWSLAWMLRMQPQPHIVARGQYRVHVGGKAGQQPGELIECFRRGQLVEIIDNHRDAAASVGELRQHPVDHRRCIEAGCRRRRFRVSGRGRRVTDRVEQGKPELSRYQVSARDVNGT